MRRFLGWNSPLYKLFSDFLNYYFLIVRETPSTVFALKRLSDAPAGASAVLLKFSILAHPIFLRPGSRDLSVALNNFIRREYGAFLPQGNPKILVDGGAYIGDTTAFFLSCYPTLRAMAYEPMDDSFEMACKNLAFYRGRVELFRAAISFDGESISMDGAQTNARIVKSGLLEIASVTILQILEALPEGYIDILKLDIEGAEGLIFSNSPELWLNKVGFLVIETHGPEITQIVLNALYANQWVVRRKRNLYFCWKN